jgi:CheY-like chemotaxis protein
MPPSAGVPTSLIDLLVDALQEVAEQAAANGVELAWTVDPALPPYISTKRIDLRAIVLVLLHRALSMLSDSMLHLTVAGSGREHVLIQLEDMGQSKKLALKEWEQLVFWIDDIGGDITRVDDGLMWTIKLPLDTSGAKSFERNDSQLKILLAIADTDVRVKIVGFLRQFKHVFVESPTQRQAIELCVSHEFDMVVLDADLPGTKALNQLDSELVNVFTERVFVALLSNVQPSHGTSLWKAHAWLPKPPEVTELAMIFDAASQFKMRKLTQLSPNAQVPYAS